MLNGMSKLMDFLLQKRGLEKYSTLGLANTNTSKIIVVVSLQSQSPLASLLPFVDVKNSKLAEKVVAKMWRKLPQQLADTTRWQKEWLAGRIGCMGTPCHARLPHLLQLHC